MISTTTISSTTTTTANINTASEASLPTLRLLSMIPLIIIVMGTIFNTISFFIFTLNKEMSKYSSMVFLAFIAVCDTVGLFEWNLSHFVQPNFDFAMDYINLASCKLISFLQYTSLQSSGLLYSIISVDRYFTVISKPGSFVSKLPFGTRKSAFIWSFGIIIVISLLNLHLLIFNGFYEEVYVNATDFDKNITELIKRDKLRCYESKLYQILPLWDMIQAVIYSIIPFIVMTIFNILLILNVLMTKKSHHLKGANKSANTGDKKKQRLTVSLISITCLFIVMTFPGTLSFGFFYFDILSHDFGWVVLYFLDSLMFIQQTMLFWVSLLTNQKFASIVKENLKKFTDFVCFWRKK